MRRLIENLEAFAVDVILEQRNGLRADILRSILYFFSWFYIGITQARLRLYRNRFYRSRTTGTTVISVGNLTVGGTGKTPVVELLAKTLRDQGRKVTILSRGYKSVPEPLAVRLWGKISGKESKFHPRIVSDGTSLLLDSRSAGDEPFMLANNLRNVSVLVHRDRVRSGIYAVKNFSTDTLILDDGYQYLRLKRTFEIALVDRTAPFGNEFLLPRGTLREIPRNLNRATHIFLTKCDGSDNGKIIERIRTVNPSAPIIECSHRPTILRNLTTGEVLPLDFLKRLKVGGLCAIAVPEGFYSALRALGARVLLTKNYTDHHRFAQKEINNFIQRCARRDIEAILTTEKDAVRIPRITSPEIPIYYMRIEIDIRRGQQAFENLIHDITTQKKHIKNS